jgi:hypothetical protein
MVVDYGADGAGGAGVDAVTLQLVLSLSLARAPRAPPDPECLLFVMLHSNVGKHFNLHKLRTVRFVQLNS